MSLDLEGRIATKCGVTGAQRDLALGAVGVAGAMREQTMAFTVDCNTPFTCVMSSANGEMRHQSATAGPGFLSGFPYHAALTISTDDGGTLRTGCDSAQLSGAPGQAAGCEADSGQTTSMGKQGALTVSWTPSGAPLLAGAYSDDLRLVIAAKD